MKEAWGLSIFSFFTWAALVAAFFVPAYAGGNGYWQDIRASVPIHTLATNGSVYIAGGGYYGNGLWTSTDLKSWTRAALPATVDPEISTVAYYNGTFFAVGNTILTSTDGVKWSRADVPLNLGADYSALTYGNGLYIVVGENSDSSQAVVLTSADGAKWTSQATGIPAPAAGGETLLDGAAWNGTRFVAMGTAVDGVGTISDIAITSTDGKSWSQVSLPANGAGGFTYTSNYNDVLAYGNGVFVGGGGVSLAGSLTGDIYTSSDGLHWTTQALPDFIASGIQFVNGRFIAAGQTFSYPQKNGFLTSTDGATWSYASVNPDARMQNATFIHTGGQYMIAGEAGIWSSPDLTTWTPLFAGPQSNAMQCLADSPEAGYVIGGAYPSAAILTSANGTDWPQLPTPVSVQVGFPLTTYSDGCIAAGPTGFVSRGYYSPDGMAWNASTVPANTDIELVAYNGSYYLAIASNSANSMGDYDVLTSVDGSTWTRVPDNLPFLSVAEALQVFDGRFYLTAQTGAPGWAVLSSDDGGTWTDVSPPVPADGFPHIGYGNGMLVAMWNDSDRNVFIANSTDGGAHWNTETDAFSDGVPFMPASIAYGNGGFVAVGRWAAPRTFTPQGDNGAYLASRDGVHWTLARDNAIGPFNTLLWNGTEFIATGRMDIVSSDGGLPSVLLDLSSAAPVSVGTGAPFSVKLTIANNGSVRADNVALDDDLPGGVHLTDTSASQGFCTSGSGSVSCKLGTIKIGAAASVTLAFTSGSSAGNAVNRATVNADQPMSEEATVQAESTVVVRKPSADGGTGGGNTSSGGGAFGALGCVFLLAGLLRRRRCGVSRV